MNTDALPHPLVAARNRRRSEELKMYPEVKSHTIHLQVASETGVEKSICKDVIEAYHECIKMHILEGKRIVIPELLMLYAKQYDGKHVSLRAGVRKGEKYWIEPFKALKIIEDIVSIIRLNPDNNYRTRTKRRGLKKMVRTEEKKSKPKKKR